MDVKTIARCIGAKTKENAPKILTGASIAGSLATILLTVKATNKSTTKIEEIRDARIDPGNGVISYTKKEERIAIVKACWKYWIPVLASFIATNACTIGSNVSSTKREAAALALYSASQRAFDEYKAIAKEELGEDKAKKLDEQLATKSYDDTGIYVTGNGGYLFKDKFTGQYFRSSPEVVEGAFKLFAERLKIEDQKANELYTLLGIPAKRLPDVGDTHYFKSEDAIGEFLPCFDYTSSDWGEPCCELIFPIDPIKR